MAESVADQIKAAGIAGLHVRVRGPGGNGNKRTAPRTYSASLDDLRRAGDAILASAGTAFDFGTSVVLAVEDGALALGPSQRLAASR